MVLSLQIFLQEKMVEHTTTKVVGLFFNYSLLLFAT